MAESSRELQSDASLILNLRCLAHLLVIASDLAHLHLGVDMADHQPMTTTTVVDLPVATALVVMITAAAVLHRVVVTTTTVAVLTHTLLAHHHLLVARVADHLLSTTSTRHLLVAPTLTSLTHHHQLVAMSQSRTPTDTGVSLTAVHLAHLHAGTVDTKAATTVAATGDYPSFLRFRSN